MLNKCLCKISDIGICLDRVKDELLLYIFFSSENVCTGAVYRVLNQETLEFLNNLMYENQKYYLQDFIGLPIELTYEGESVISKIESWRVLTEVL